jgi:hypothetical protein
MADNLRRWSTLPLVPALPLGEAGLVFPINCPTHRSEVLVPPTRIRGLRNTGHGILLVIECWCGTHVALRTGRHRPEPAAEPTTAGPPRPAAVAAGQGSNL